jgi:hypothetical protein
LGSLRSLNVRLLFGEVGRLKINTMLFLALRPGSMPSLMPQSIRPDYLTAMVTFWAGLSVAAILSVTG